MTESSKQRPPREFWVFDDGGPEFDRRVLDRPISANDVHVIEHSAYQSALDKIASLEKMIELSEKALEFISSGCLVPPDGGSPKFEDAINSANEAREQIKQMKAGK